MVVFLAPEGMKPESMPPEAAELHRGELAAGRQLVGEDALRQSWELDGDRHGAVCLFEAGSREELDAMVQRFPEVAQGGVETQVFGLKPDGAYVEVD